MAGKRQKRRRWPRRLLLIALVVLAGVLLMLYLTGRSSSVLCFFAPLLSLLFLVPCGLLWRLGVRRYKSTGS